MTVMPKSLNMIDFKKKIEDDRLVKVSRMKPVIKPTRPHKHDGYHELIFLSKGSGIHSIDNNHFDVRPSTGFYLKPGQVHCWDFSQIPEGYVILFREEVMSGYDTTLNNLFRMSEKFDLPENVDLFILLEQFYNGFKSGENQEILKAYLNLTLLRTLEFAERKVVVEPTTVAEFYKFKTMVNEHFLKHRQVSDYAGLMNISVHRLNAVCKEAAHTSAINIIKERVLIEAKNMMSHTNLNVSEIAYGLNFSDASNFIKFFKSLTSLTPLQYRSGLK